MDNEVESKIIALQICIDEGHSFEADRDSLDGDSISLTCSSCEYTKRVEVTEEQLRRIDKLFDDEDKLQREILKNG